METGYIADIVQEGFSLGSSDIHLVDGRPAFYRINGRLICRAETEPLSGETIRAWGMDLLAGCQGSERIDEAGQKDFAITLTGLGRLRVNIYFQAGSWAAALRLIPREIPGLDFLGVPEIMKDLLNEEAGLILVSGAAGNGKSTTLAGMIGYINQHQSRHIVTLEDPIEFIHLHNNSIISQREIGSDTPDFAQGLKSALRQDPDVIMVGEMRDYETMAIAVTAAETGHLVLASLHSRSAVQTLERIIDVFPHQHQAQIRGQLASALLGIMNQQLIPSPDGRKRWLAAEIMVTNYAIRNLIRESRVHQIESAIQTGTALGMTSMAKSIRSLLQQKKITPHEARRRMGADWLSE
ncbi:MAG: PilT/PilU family type 4a pilus ATPase [Syntrophomonadaceae bacterium]